ncbi:MAG: 50S ribosomal protein L9 [Planctomycetes bacterium]|nr:50S ribosomal protein L9 [Planctomycetota bacterium]
MKQRGRLPGRHIQERDAKKMKLLLRKDIAKLGIIGDVVNVADGYGRNYLLPQNLATQPTDANMRALSEERKQAEQRRRERREAQEAAAARLREVEVTIAAVANEEGVLYGSVGPREIAAALREEGHEIDTASINLHTPIRRLDNIVVEVTLGEDIRAEVKVWVVRSKGSPEDAEGHDEDAPDDQEATAGREAGANDGGEY